MNGAASLLQELNESISQGSNESRLQALWHTTDILLAGQYSEDQIWIFGQVIESLARELEVTARAQLARRLANSNNAPITCINKLAYDNSIDVAGPVLRKSERLDTRTLVSIASSESQQHLLAISKRKSITEPVTDVLAAIGNREVVNSLAKNPGARFSHFGFLQFIKRSDHDSILIENLGLRNDIPRHIFQQLIAKASDEVKKKLEREHPEITTQIQTSVADVTGELHSIFGPASKNYFCAKKAVYELHRYGNLHERTIFEYAQSHKLQEVTIALSLLCSLPANVIERGLIDSTGEMPMIFVKALEFSWETMMSLLFLGAPNYKISARDLDALKVKFSQLTIETAKSLIRLYQSRKAASD